MRATRFIAGVSTTMVAVVSLGVTPPAAREGDRTDAAAVWEQAVAAKGWRERLAAIQSFAIRQSTKFRRQTLREYAAGRVDQVVCRLPHDWWEFLDYRPGLMGYSVRVVDTRTGLGWATSGGPARAYPRPDTSTAYRMRQLQYVYFLETRAVRPIALRVSQVRLASRAADRVEAQFEDDFIVFFFDSATRLPVRVETVYRYTLKPPRPGMKSTGEMKYVFELYDYRPVDGIQLPSRATMGGDATDLHVETNPDYEPSIFARPPSPTDAIDSWRRH
jgi:hypothetical protein